MNGRIARPGCPAVLGGAGVVVCWTLILALSAASVGAASSAGAFSERLTSRPLPGLRADVATLIVQGATGGGLDLAVAADLGAGGSARRLDLTVELSGESLLNGLPESVSSRLAVEFYAYVIDERSSVVAHLARELAVPLDEWGERLSSGGLRFVEELEVPPGELSVRTLVAVPAAGRFGMVVTGLSVPSEAAPLGRPRSEEICGDWLAVVPLGAGPVEPTSARAVWRAGDRVELRLPARALEVAGPVAATVSFTSSEGERRSIPVEARAVPPGGALALALTIPDLDSGIYSLSVAADERGESPATEVWVLAGSDAVAAREIASVCSWPAVMAQARDALDGSAPERRALGGQKGSLRRRTAREYGEILRAFGEAGDLEAAVVRLADWEVATTSVDMQVRLPAMAAGQVTFLQKLAEVDRESLLPAFELHRRAYSVHFERRDFGLAGHSRRLATSVAEIWLDSLERGDEPGWVADALVGLGGIADRHRMFAASQGLLERAAEVAPGNRSARMLLSMLYEKLGEYDAAIDHLKELVAVAPADSEAWLRLATLQCRRGRSNPCERSLRRVLGQRPRPWILSLGYQTLVQRLFADERFAEGLRALDEAALLLPGDPALGLARAYGLDRLGRVAEAARVLANLPGRDGDMVSPRLRYVEAGDDVARRVAQRLRRSLVVRQALLARAAAEALEEPA